MYATQMNLMDIINAKDESRQNLLKTELSNIGGYVSVKDLFDDLKQLSEQNNPKAIRLYRFAEWLSDENLFYSLVNLLPELKSSVHAEYAIKAITQLPSNSAALCEAVSKLLECVQSFQEPGVLYQAVALLSRMEKIEPNVMTCLRNAKKIKIDEDVLKEVSNRMENLTKYEEDFHKNSDVRAEFTSNDKFLEFASEFIDFKNAL